MRNLSSRFCSCDRATSSRYVRSCVVILFTIFISTPVAAEEASDRGFFGLTPTPTERGLAVKGVTPDGPAEKAGIEPGDLLISIDGKPVAGLSYAEIPDVFTAYRAGETVDVVYRRGRNLETARVDLARVPQMTLEEQRRIAEIERKVRASEVMKRILMESDVIELSRAETGELRYRPDGDAPWELLDRYVSEDLEPVWKVHSRDGRKVVRLRIQRAEDGSVEELVPID